MQKKVQKVADLDANMLQWLLAVATNGSSQARPNHAKRSKASVASLTLALCYAFFLGFFSQSYPIPIRCSAWFTFGD